MASPFADYPHNDFFKCSICQSHIASNQHYHYTFLPNGEPGGIGLNIIVNVEFRIRFHEFGNQLVADIRCKVCKTHLGWKLNSPGMWKFLLIRDMLDKGDDFEWTPDYLRGSKM